MATGGERYPPNPNDVSILFWLTYPDNSVKIHAYVQTVEHPQTLRPQNLKVLSF